MSKSHIRQNRQKFGVEVLGREPENLPCWPGEWAQVYHCGGSTAGLGLRGTGTDAATGRRC